MFLEHLWNFSLTSSALFSLAVATGILLVFRWIVTQVLTLGPWGIPILGYYPFLRKDFYVQLHELSIKYGPVYHINIAGQDYLYLGNAAAIKEAHVTKADCFPSRGHKPGVGHDIFENGLSFLEDDHWKVQRKFFVQAMREIGLSRNSQELQGPISNGIQTVLDAFNENHGQPTKVFPLMMKECTNVVLRLFLGDDISEEMANKLNQEYMKVLLPMADENLLLVGNVAKFLILSRSNAYKEMLESKNKMIDILSQIVEEHKANLNPDQPPRDFIDMYLLEKDQRQKKGDSQVKYFTDADLLPTLLQAYGDGSVSIGLFVAMFIREFSFHQEAQKACYEEIIRVVGSERLPEWSDRPSLPIFNSVLKELIRFGRFASALPDLECVKDTTVMGVKAPKGCMTLMNMWAANHDPNVYENPYQFDMFRFMPDKGSVEPATFGVGKRSCAGEGLVMTEVFLFMAAIIQNFCIKPETERGNEDITDFEEFIKERFMLFPRTVCK